MPLLHSKLVIPELPATFVERPRLLRLLDGAATPVTLISAPAGWGKTVLLSSWARRAAAKERVAWLSIEPEDNHEQFWSYIEAALAEPLSGIGDPPGPGHAVRPYEPAPQAGSGPSPDEAYLAQLADALAHRRDPAVLILDDLHHLDDLDVLHGLEFVLRHAAGGLRLVLATRADPRLPLHRWRLRGDLTAVRASDLALTVAETAQLMARHGLVLPDAHLHALWAQAEGWPGGLRLAALFLAEHGVVSDTVVSGPGVSGYAALAAADPMVAEYLLAEVVADQPAEIREMLVCTSVADRLCGGLVDALAGRRDGETLLAQLVGANAFLRALDSEPGWYRYHRMFHAVLRAQLHRRSPNLIADLHRRAARWLADHDLPAEAVHHALAARDWDGAVAVLDERWCELAMSGSGRTVHRPRVADAAGGGPPSLSPSPAEEDLGGASRNPTQAAPGGELGAAVALALAACRLDRHDPAAAEVYLRLAERWEPAGGGRAVMTASFRLAQAQLMGDPTRIRAAAQHLFELATMSGDALAGSGTGDELGGPGNQRAAAMALAALGSAQLNLGELDAAEASLRDGLGRAEQTGSELVGVACAGRLALVSAVRGQLRGAQTSAGLALAAPPDWARSIHCAYAHLALALVAAERARQPEAEAELSQAADLASVTCAAPSCRGPRQAEPALAVWVAIVRARLLREHGDLARGFEVLLAGRRDLGESVVGPLRDWFTAAEAELRTCRGDTKTVRGALAPVVENGSDAPAPHAVALARAYLRDNDPGAAARVLPAWADDSTGHLLPVRLDAGLVEALAARRTGDARGASRSLERVLQLAEPEGFRRVFTQDGAGLRDLLLEHLDSGTAYWSTVTELIAATACPAASTGRGANIGTAPIAGPAGVVLASASAPVSPDARGPAPPIERLTERELTVLRYLQSILSLVEIAAELSVSINTVKTHVRSIYRKLAAPRRRDAVRRARELHLL